MEKIKASFRVAITLCVIVLVVLAIVKMQSRKCEKIQVRFLYEGESPTLSEQSVLALLSTTNIPIIGEKLKEVDMKGITVAVTKHPYVERVNKLAFAGTTLIVSLELKMPVLHIFPANGKSYFMDKNGALLPYSSSVTENVIVANGAINQQYDKNFNIDSCSKVMARLFLISQAILEDPFSTAQFRQMYVNEKQEIELMPTVGNHVVLFGTEENACEKLFNLKETYSHALAYGMEHYKQLDARYKNRIIAKKR